MKKRLLSLLLCMALLVGLIPASAATAFAAETPQSASLGNGALLLPNVTYEFTYKIKKDQISIDYENESVRDGTYSFSVENNTLTLIGGEGTIGGTYTLTWVKEEQPPIRT